MIEMKTDVQVLDAAMTHLQQEGMWCQQAWMRTDRGSVHDTDDFDFVDDHSKIIGMCAEGAIRLHAGYYQMMKEKQRAGSSHHSQQQDLYGQIHRVEKLVAEKVKALVGDTRPTYGLNYYNDDEGMTAETILLGFKHAREELDG